MNSKMNDWWWYGCPSECMHVEMKEKGLHTAVRCTCCKQSILADTELERWEFYSRHKLCSSPVPNVDSSGLSGLESVTSVVKQKPMTYRTTKRSKSNVKKSVRKGINKR